MEKLSYHNTSYKGVSGLERVLLERIAGSGVSVFGIKEAVRLTGFNRARAHNLLASLAKKGRVVKVLRNRYCLRETVFENPFAVATRAFVPSYVSFWSALSFYGFTEQQLHVVQIAATKQFRKVKLREISVQPVTLKPKSFFGYIELNGFAIASKEKALVDSALNFENAGGFGEFTKCLRNAWKEINKGAFVEFLLKANNRSLNSRIGYLIEETGLSTSKRLLQKIHAKKSNCFVKLSPKKGSCRNYNKKWNIIVNDSIEETQGL